MASPPDRIGPKRAAIFDLDRTITQAGTFTPFLLSTRPAGPARAALLARFLPHMLIYKAGFIDRKTLKNRMMAMALAGLSRARIAELAELFVARIMANGVHADAIAAIARHRADGDMTILATASVDFYAQLFAERLGLDDCIASKTNFKTDGDKPPQIISENCYGEAKRAMVAARIDTLYSGEKENLSISFYTDHISDLPLLEKVDAPYVVNPKAALRNYAQNAEWPIFSWTALESYKA